MKYPLLMALAWSIQRDSPPPLANWVLSVPKPGTLKFSEAIVHDGEYLSYEAYLEVTGAESSTEPKPVPG